MTPREAYSIVASYLPKGVTRTVPEALDVLERLVSKDEAEAKAVQRVLLTRTAGLAPVKRVQPTVPPLCTCGTSTPCAVWGHS